MSEKSEQTELLPCPFCGKNPQVVTCGEKIVFYAVLCVGCCSTSFNENRSAATEKWSTRIDQTDLADKIADRLFTNGAGERAKALILQLEDGGNGCGWSREAARKQIIEVLRGEK